MKKAPHGAELSKRVGVKRGKQLIGTSSIRLSIFLILVAKIGVSKRDQQEITPPEGSWCGSYPTWANGGVAPLPPGPGQRRTGDRQVRPQRLGSRKEISCRRGPAPLPGCEGIARRDRQDAFQGHHQRQSGHGRYGRSSLILPAVRGVPGCRTFYFHAKTNTVATPTPLTRTRTPITKLSGAKRSTYD